MSIVSISDIAKCAKFTFDVYQYGFARIYNASKHYNIFKHASHTPNFWGLVTSMDDVVNGTDLFCSQTLNTSNSADRSMPSIKISVNCK